MLKKTISIDIDSTLRDFGSQVEKFLEMDHPDILDEYTETSKKTFRALDPLFDSIDESLHEWMYDYRVFQLFGQANRTHPKVIDDLNIFTNCAENQGFSVVIASVQKGRSITATLHWLSKWGCRIKNYRFFDSMQEKIDANFDIYLDDCPEVLEAYEGKTTIHPRERTITEIPRAIKVPYGYNKGITCPTVDIVNGDFDTIYNILGVEKVLKKEGE